ncbi:MAG TPA: methyl-accepting chemotaxis protein [Kofleriaceae bacterium]|nr:methyl-accepting chemotaxis protein [Kofleriaceae bacterium]
MTRSPIVRTVTTILALDALFSVLLGYAFITAMGVDEGTGTCNAVLAGVWVAKSAAWSLFVTSRMRPLSSFAAAPHPPTQPAAIIDAATAGYRAPFIIGLSWAVAFAGQALVHALILYFGFADTVALGPRSLEGSVMMSLGVLIGATALGFPLTEWLMAPIVESISLIAQEQRVAIPGRGLSFRTRLVGFALTVALAPSIYLGSLTYMNDAQASQRELVRQAELAVLEAALGHPDAVTALGGQLFSLEGDGEKPAGGAAAAAFAGEPALARMFERAAAAAPNGFVAHPRYGVVAFRTEAGKRLGVVIRSAPSVSAGTIVLLLVFLVIVAVWGPLSAVFIGNSTAAPVARISDALARVGEGAVENAPRVPVFHQDEVGALAMNYNAMVEQLRELARRANEVSKGDLDVEIAVRGDLGEAFRGQLLSLRDMVGHIAQNASQLAGAASEMYAAAQEQETVARQQSVGVEEVSRTMESLLIAATHVTDSTMGVLAKAERTLETTSRTSARITEMSGHANRIGEILDVIREIADRSDLLALNASLEGCNAGEAGRGFALLAGEMRKLAERVTQSVHDVKKLVADVRSSVSATVMATEESSKLAEGTTESARQINLVTQQQRSGTEQAGQSMRDVASMITQSLAATQQIRALAENLKVQADRLTGLVARFRLPEPRRREAA